MAQLLKKTVFQAIIFSLLVHVAAMGVFAFFKVANKKFREVEVFLQIPEPVEQLLEIPPIKEPEPIVENTPPAVGSHNEAPDSKDKVDTTRTDSVKKFDRAAFFVSTPKIIFRQPMQNVKIDSVDTMDVNIAARTSMPLFDAKESLRFHTRPGSYNDRIQRDIDQQNLGHPQLLSFGNALGQGAEYLSDLFDKKKENKPVRLDFIPNDAELDILETLWDHAKATDHEIYAALDTAIRMTAVDFNGIMEKLEKKGLVTRTLVSPQQKFTFPIVKVEMSAKNRRNRVYEYKYRIQAADVVRYLQAVLYEVEYGASTTNDSTRTDLMAGLKAKIVRLLEREG